MSWHHRCSKAKNSKEDSSGAGGLTATYRNSQRPAAPFIRPTASGSGCSIEVPFSVPASTFSSSDRTAFGFPFPGVLPSLDNFWQKLPTRLDRRLRSRLGHPPADACISRAQCTPKMLLLVSNVERSRGLATWTAIHQQRQLELGSYGYGRASV